MLFVKAIVRMGLDVTDKLLCYFAMAPGERWLDPPIPSINIMKTMCENYGRGGGDQLRIPWKPCTYTHTFCKGFVFVSYMFGVEGL